MIETNYANSTDNSEAGLNADVPVQPKKEFIVTGEAVVTLVAHWEVVLHAGKS